VLATRRCESLRCWGSFPFFFIFRWSLLSYDDVILQWFGAACTMKWNAISGLLSICSCILAILTAVATTRVVGSVARRNL
jgi:hypothetical protein